MMQDRSVIAAFDFDDTLITKDSLLDFLSYSFSRSALLLNILLFSPNFIKFKLGIINNGVAKERLLRLFIQGMSNEAFTKLCNDYCVRLSTIENPDAIQRLKWHQSKGHDVVIISASVEDWVKPWAKKIEVSKVIATKLERIDNRLTGKLQGNNCFGKEKVIRFQKEYPNRENYQLYMYGDGKSDQEMFKLADFAFQERFE
jgi:phosphatidylglycerophosphatase C